jgi:hypothetical protein
MNWRDPAVTEEKKEVQYGFAFDKHDRPDGKFEIRFGVRDPERQIMFGMSVEGAEDLVRGLTNLLSSVTPDQRRRSG